MKAKTSFLIIDGHQLVLGAIMLILLSVWIAAHLFYGHFNFIGFVIASGVWYIVFNLFRMSLRDFLKTKRAKAEDFDEKDFEN